MRLTNEQARRLGIKIEKQKPTAFQKMAAAADRAVLLERLLMQLRVLGAPAPALEFRFHPAREWRFDLAWPDVKVAAEVDGGVLSRGRHVRPAGFTEDQVKRNTALELGWRVFAFAGSMVTSGEAADLLIRVIKTAKI